MNVTHYNLLICLKVNIVPPDFSVCSRHDEQNWWECWRFSSGLGLLVRWLSDPDNLNQLVVSQLDSATPKGSVEELSGSDPDQTSLASQESEGRDEWVAVIFFSPLARRRCSEPQSNSCESHLRCLEIGADLILFDGCFYVYCVSRSLAGAGISTRTRIKTKRKGSFLWFELFWLKGCLTLEPEVTLKTWFSPLSVKTFQIKIIETWETQME